MESANKTGDQTVPYGECKQNRNTVPCGDRYPLNRTGNRTVPCGECTQNRRQDSALWRVCKEKDIGQCLVESVHRTREKTVPRGEYYY